MVSQSDTLPPEIVNTVGLIFLLERRLEYLFDKVLAPHDLTTKQWLLLAVIDKSGFEKPALQEVARQLNTSHQNVKAIAVNLEKRGFLRLEKDEKDKRVTRLIVTPASRDFWQAREPQDIVMFRELFQQLTAQEIKSFPPLLLKLLYGVQEMTDKLTAEPERGQG